MNEFNEGRGDSKVHKIAGDPLENKESEWDNAEVDVARAEFERVGLHWGDCANGIRVLHGDPGRTRGEVQHGAGRGGVPEQEFLRDLIMIMDLYWLGWPIEWAKLSAADFK